MEFVRCDFKEDCLGEMGLVKFWAYSFCFNGSYLTYILSICVFLSILMTSSFFPVTKREINPQCFSRLCKRICNYRSAPRTAPSATLCTWTLAWGLGCVFWIRERKEENTLGKLTVLVNTLKVYEMEDGFMALFQNVLHWL